MKNKYLDKFVKTDYDKLSNFNELNFLLHSIVSK